MSLQKNIEAQVLQDYPHGFGIGGDWADDVSTWLTRVLS